MATKNVKKQKLQQLQQEAENQIEQELQRYGAIQNNDEDKDQNKNKLSKLTQNKPPDILSQDKYIILNQDDSNQKQTLSENKLIENEQQQKPLVKKQYKSRGESVKKQNMDSKPQKESNISIGPTLKRYTPFQPAQIKELTNHSEVVQSMKSSAGSIIQSRINSAAIQQTLKQEDTQVQMNSVISEILSTNVSTQNLGSTEGHLLFNLQQQHMKLSQASLNDNIKLKSAVHSSSKNNLPTIIEKQTNLNAVQDSLQQQQIGKILRSSAHNKRGLPIAAVDHKKAKEKLQKLIESTDPKNFGASINLKQKSSQVFQVSQNQYSESNYSNLQEDHAKMIQSLPSFNSGGTSTRRGFSYDVRSNISNLPSTQNKDKKLKKSQGAQDEELSQKDEKINLSNNRIKKAKTGIQNEKKENSDNNENSQLDNNDLDFSHVPKIGNRAQLRNSSNVNGIAKAANQNSSKINEDIQNVLSGVNDPKIQRMLNLRKKKEAGKKSSQATNQSPQKSPSKKLSKILQQPQIVGTQTKKKPSKYMLEIFRINFIQLVHKYDKFQASKRVKALRKVRRNLQKKFMKLYKMFRFKKYGEPYLNDQTTWSIHDYMSENDQIPLVEYPQSIKETQKLINSKLDQIDRYLSGKNESDKASLKSPARQQTISDLHTVKEDLDDEYNEEDDRNEFGIDQAKIEPNLNPQYFVRTQGEYEDFVYCLVEKSCISQMILEHSQKIQKVKSFLLQLVVQKRLQKQNRMSSIIQKYIKGYKAWKECRNEIIEKRNIILINQLKKKIQLASKIEKEKMDQSQKIIKKIIFSKIEQKKEGKILREQLKKLPYICRSGFVKMHDLKKSSNILQNEAKSIFKI